MSNGTGNNVLCPALYERLRQLSAGGVVIANQGEAMYVTSYQHPQTGQLMTVIHSSGEYYRVNCPYCRDTRHRLWINHRFGQFDAAGQRMFYLATCYNENCLANSANCRNFIDVLFGFRNAQERRRSRVVWGLNEGVVDTEPLGPVEAPGRVFPLHRFYPEHAAHTAFRYMLEQRRYTLELLQTYQVGYCTEADPRYPLAQDRIVFPIFMDGAMVGWQCRYPGDLDWKAAGVPKYFGRPHMKKRLMLYNIDRARTMPYVVVVEGVTDVHRVGNTAVAALGKTVSFPQQQLLLGTWAGKPIILMFDPGTTEEMRGVVEDLVRFNTSPIIPIELPPGPDPGDWEHLAINQFIHVKAREAGITLPWICA